MGWQGICRFVDLGNKKDDWGKKKQDLWEMQRDSNQ